jgi:hypothetical protein
MQAQQQQQAYPQPDPRAPPPHVSPKGTWVTKLVFRMLATIFSIALIGLGAHAAESLSYSYYSFVTYAPIIFFGGPVCSMRKLRIKRADRTDNPLLGRRDFCMEHRRDYLYTRAPWPPWHPPRRCCWRGLDPLAGICRHRRSVLLCGRFLLRLILF